MKKLKSSIPPLLKEQGFWGCAIGILLSLYLLYWLLRFNILPPVFLGLILAILVLVLAIVWMLFFYQSNLVKKIIAWIMVAAVGAGCSLTSFYMQSTYDALSKMSDQKTKENYVGLYVLKSSVIDDIEDLNGRKIGVLKTINRTHSNEMIQYLDQQNIEYELVEYDSSIVMARNLKGMAIDAIILDETYISIIEDYNNLEYFHDDVYCLYEIPFEVEQTNNADAVNVTNTPFTILISGIDTYGDIGMGGRSDVNILITINPVSKIILLTSIPRDYYVETVCEPEAGCAQGQMDKLTHTGFTGIETTQATLEKLFGISINYNVRVNFSSVISIIDELGGVDVKNVDSFTSGGYVFEKGVIHMDGQKALVFARERYSFREGDRERGRNQMRVIAAIIEKALSPVILANYTNILNAVSDSIEMNLTAQDIASLVRMQLENGSSWRVYTTSVDGTDDQQYAFELGDFAYVMIPDENSVANAKLNMQAVDNGEIPPYAAAVSQ